MKKPFQINIDDSIIDDLKYRLSNTRWPNEVGNDNWEAGTDKTYLKELCDYWQNDFDWTKQETYLNSFNQFKSTIDGIDIHFIHEKGKGIYSIPLLLTHGFPDSFVRFLKVIPLFTKADEDGFSFDVIVPSIPGYGFSGIPKEPGMNPKKIADLFTKLMTDELAYQRFFAHGGDWGSSITEQIAINYPQHLSGMHLTDIPYYHLFTIPPGELSEPEKKYLEAGKKWSMTEGAYAMIQSTKPQTVAYGLNDSPVGMAAWIIEKFYRWSDNGGNIENCFTKDELLTNLTIYWATQTINSAIRIYYESAKAVRSINPADKPKNKVEVPTGAAIFPKDLVPAPKEFGERLYNIKHWTEMEKGGHFAAMEQPELFSADIKTFAKSV